MKYMGSKSSFAKDILPIILKNRKDNQWYVEPFAGGMNIIDKVDGNRIASDKNNYLIDMFNAIIYNNWNPPMYVSEETYNDIKNNKQNYSTELVGYVGFNSYGGKFFAGYRRDKEGKRDYWKEHYNNIMKQIPKLNGVILKCCDFINLQIPNNSIIYCDPPYKGTTKYIYDFDYELFWDWCRTQHKNGHIIFISEYNAPADFKCVWYKETKSQINDMNQIECKKTIEKLFIPY